MTTKDHEPTIAAVAAVAINCAETIAALGDLALSLNVAVRALIASLAAEDATLAHRMATIIEDHAPAIGEERARKALSLVEGAADGERGEQSRVQ